MAKNKSPISALFIYNNICENVKKLEKFYDFYIHRLKNFSRGLGVCPTLGHGFLEEVGQNTPCAPMMGEQIF